MLSMKNRFGFTLIELTIIIGILGIIAGITGGFIGAATSNANLGNFSVQGLDTLRRAHWQTMHGNNDDVWSVHFETGQFVLFKGMTYSALASTNIEFPVDSPISITSISLNGSGADVIFDAVTGDSSTYGTVTFTDASTGDSDVITINQVGMIDLD